MNQSDFVGKQGTAHILQVHVVVGHVFEQKEVAEKAQKHIWPDQHVKSRLAVRFEDGTFFVIEEPDISQARDKKGLVRITTDEEAMAIIRDNARARLSSDERQALGIS